MKYIVYKTTNLINGYIYIGVHKTENPDIFDKYLGNGIYINKPYTYNQAKTCFQKAVKYFGVKNFKRETLGIYDTPEEAYKTEELLVNEKFLARSDVYNMIKGGIINQISGKTVYMYSVESGNYESSFNSLEDASKYLNTDSGVIYNSIKYRFQVKKHIFDFNKLEKIDLSLYNFKSKQVVYRYTKEGNFDKEFQSLTIAGKESLDTSAIYIQKAAILGYLVKDMYYFSFYKSDGYDKARTLQIKNRPVYKYSSDGKFLSEYLTQEIAEKENKNSNITKSIKYRSIDDNNFYWSLEKLDFYNIPIKHTSKKVAKIDSDGKILQTWDSSNLCAKEVGTAVKNVLRGKYELHKGFKYIYL